MTRTLIRKPEMHHVAVLDDVVFAFEPHFASFFCARFAITCDVVRVGDGLGADEAFFEIGVDDARGGRGLGAACDRPGAGFLGADGEIGDEVEQRVAGEDKPVEASFFQSHLGQEGVAVFNTEAREFAFDLG